ncbi:caspase family protein [Gemmata sp. JC717]|uniref:caspase family protein n=1 Tax=Gemmata algarum TaxID=2975278 RepID=UPI0021BBABC4|nr:caspase family protein [Gemmata algarum]MDY3551257.1 caspase family protein [Gemmata algarum]
MPVLKTTCPECGANLRLTVEGDGDHEVTCLKCGHEFAAALESDEHPPAKAGTKEKAKSGAKAGSTNVAPKKKKKKPAEAESGGNQKLIVAGAGAGLILVLGLGLVVYAAMRTKDKTVKNADPPAQTVTEPSLVSPSPSGPQPGAASGPPAPKPNPGVPPKPGSTPSPGANPPAKKKDNPEDAELATMLPPPPKIRVNESMVPATKPLVVAPAVPPVAPDEDPFVRAQNFKPEGALPPPPPLPKGGGRPLLTLDSGGHTGTVGKVFFTPKGDRIITVGEDKAVRFWEPVSNETVKTIRFPAGPGKEGALQAAAISRSGKRLAVAGCKLAGVQSGRVPIYIISPDTGNQITRIDAGSGDAVSALHFSNDGARLAAGGEDGVLQLFDVGSGRELGRTVPHRGGIVEVRYNPNPRWNILASLGTDQSVKLWDFARNNTLLVGIGGVVPTCMAWSNDGQMLALGTKSGEILIASIQGQLLRTLPSIKVEKRAVSVFQVQFMPGDQELVVGGVSNGRGWTGLISADSGVPRVTVAGHSNLVSAVDVSIDGSRVVSSGGNRHETFVWQTDDGRVQHRLIGTGHGVWAVAWAKDGKSIAWGTSNERNDANVGPLEHTFRLDEFGLGGPPDPSKYTQTVNSDEHVTLDYRQRAFMVKTTGRDPVLTRLPGGEPIYSASVLPKGNAILVGGVESLYLISPVSFEVNQKFVGHTGHVLSVTPSPDSRYFATGSADQTIRIWQRNREEPVLSIFVAGREWIAWTPQGFYACSPQGEQLIAWQINAGNVKFPQVHPAGRFRPTMYQPAVLKYLIPAGDLSKALAMAQKYDKALIQTTNVAEVLPPEVTLADFTDGRELKMDKAKGTLTVRATASSPNAKHPVTAMRLLVDGRPFNGAAGVKRFENPQPTAEATWEVPLAPGPHTVAVIADSPVSKGMSKVGQVLRDGEVPKPNLYVLTMGVAAYPGKLKLNYSATDAEMLAKAFQEKSRGTFDKIEVKVLTDKAASRQGIRDGLTWLKSKMTPQDVGIVSFSGHGSRDLFGRFYLVPFIESVTTADESEWALSGDEFKKRLEDMPGRLVAILDACHSGSVAEKDGPPQADSLVRDLTAEDSGVIVMCASLGREYAAESKICKAGFFTLGLVEGLSGHADVDGDGVIYIHELDLYATARVRQLSGGRQNPTLGRPSAVKPFVIAKPGKQAAP